MTKHHPILLAVAAAAALSAPARPSFAQPASPVEIWVRAGLFRPSDDAFRRVYTSTLVPFTAQADWRLRSTIALFGGIRYLRGTGAAVPEGGASTGTSPAEEVRLTLTAGRFGALLLVPGSRWDARLGAGVTVTHYSETWAGAGASASGTEAGWLLQAAVARRLGKRWSASVAVEYAGVEVPAGAGEFAGPAVNIGGLDLLFGVGIRF
jgi:hypothetical protein